MVVRDIVKSIRFNTEWTLKGAQTGKQLCNNYDSDKVKTKYMESEVSGIYSDLHYNCARLIIWVSGK